MKKMLFVYPNNFLKGTQGTYSRAIQLVGLFKEAGFVVDLFGYENFGLEPTFTDFEKLNCTKKLINHLYLYDCAAKENVIPFTSRVMRKLRRMLKRPKSKQYLQDWAFENARRLFKRLVEENDYDVIVLTYSYMANLLKDVHTSAKKAYFMEDSMFLQQYSWDGNKNHEITLGKLMDEELVRLNLFDLYFSISYDEKIFYEKLFGRPMEFFPHLLSDIKVVKTDIKKRKWDVLFVGHDNPYNVEGLNWFFEKVYPLLKKDIKILIVGNVTKKIEAKYRNVDMLSYVEDLSTVNEQTKVVICPMFRGTGMKIKVVEAIAQGLPVVCNERGIDGFPDKTKSGCLVTQNEKEFAFYIQKLIDDIDFYQQVSTNVKEYFDSVFNKNQYLNLLKEKL